MYDEDFRASTVNRSTNVQTAHHVGFTVSNLEASIAFWQRLGFEPQTTLRFEDAEGTGVEGADYELVLLSRPGTPLILELIHYRGVPQTRTPRNEETGAAHLALQVADVQQLYDELRSAGVEFVSAPRRQEESGVTWVYAKDPDGMTVELLELIGVGGLAAPAGAP